MNNVILPIALWTALALAGVSLLVMGLAGLRSVWYGKVKPLTIGIVSVPGVLILLFRAVMTSWVQAGIYTLVIMGALVVLVLSGTWARQAYQSAFS